ncbi:MAG: DUF4331 family protein [Myxococcota bacterium]
MELFDHSKLRRNGIVAGLLVMVAIASGGYVLAADHIDAPAAVAEPTADITDIYAWMTPDASKLNLVLNVSPFATADSAFSDAVVYAFHINSSAGYGENQTETLLLCAFADAENVECWLGDEYVGGKATDPAGLASDSGALKVFTGLRNDPFFMEFTGFTLTVDAVVAAAGSLDFDDAGCPTLDDATSAALVGQLQSGMNGAPASDTFAGANVLSLVIQVDKSLVTAGGPVLGVWASTHSAQ